MSYDYPETLALQRPPTRSARPELLADWLADFTFARIGYSQGAVELHYLWRMDGLCWFASVRVKRSGRGSCNQTRYAYGRSVEDALYRVMGVIIREFAPELLLAPLPEGETQ